MSNAKNYFLKIKGQVSGPYSVNQVQTMITRGRVNRHYQVSQDNGNSWCALGEVLELFPLDARASIKNRNHEPSVIAVPSYYERRLQNHSKRPFASDQRQLVQSEQDSEVLEELENPEQNGSSFPPRLSVPSLAYLVPLTCVIVVVIAGVILILLF